MMGCCQILEYARWFLGMLLVCYRGLPDRYQDASGVMLGCYQIVLNGCLDVCCQICYRGVARCSRGNASS